MQCNRMGYAWVIKDDIVLSWRLLSPHLIQVGSCHLSAKVLIHIGLDKQNF